MICVIGDIHGCLNTLKELVDKIKAKFPAIKIYSVGDLVDRGNFSCGVVDYIISENIVFTPGNHDYMFLHYMKDPSSALGKAWLYNGYESTMSSYEGKMDKINSHLNTIGKAPLFIDHEDCFISHAGVSSVYKSYLPYYQQDLSELSQILKSNIEDDQGILWTREELLDLGKLQIVGHTRRQEIFHSKQNNVLYIDTSVYTGNKLSAVIVNKNEIVDMISVPTFLEDLN
jgi:serine/threonine protein phosphatase 1